MAYLGILCFLLLFPSVVFYAWRVNPRCPRCGSWWKTSVEEFGPGCEKKHCTRCFLYWD